jgi:hypothetical protein
VRTKILGLLFLCFLATASFAQNNTPDLWYFQQAYPSSPALVSAIEAQIDQAFSYGYTGVVFWSSAFSFMGSSVFAANNVAYMQQVIAYAQAKGMKTTGLVSPYGYSDDVLLNNPNWAEGERLTGSQFTVNASKTALVPVNSFGGLVNPGFESGVTGWFDFKDSGLSIDTTVFHSGSASGNIANSAGLSRFHQVLNVIPWRQYHGRIWVKTANFQAFGLLEVYDPSSSAVLFSTQVGQQPTQDWTVLDFTFNSRTASQPGLYFGVWGGSSGNIWFDDALVEETSLVYVLRRPGTPLKVYDPANANHIFQEGTDFNPIADPQLSSGAFYPYNGFYHTPATVILPSSTTLQPGQTVAIDHYAVQPIQPNADVGICLTETGAQNWLKTNAQAIVNNIPGMNYLLSYDEMRHMDSCASCRAKNMTPGQLLAWHVTNTAALYNSLAPSASLYIWSDMFDPFHNAVDNYYFVEGNIAGSWAGVPANVTVMNWNLGNLTNSLNWFSGRNPQQPTAFHQVIAGYYDSGDGAAAATLELQQASGIPGVTGLMYTSWSTDYSQLQPFASAAKKNWATYLTSIVSTVTSQIKINTSAVTLNHGSGVYSQNVRLTNKGAALAAAAYVLDSLPAGVTMVHPSGATSVALPAGSPYLEIGPIGAGATVSLTIQFTRTGTQAIAYTARVLGPGPR